MAFCYKMEDDLSRANMSLPSMVKEYVQIYRPDNQIEIDWFRSLPTIEEAVLSATLAVDYNGKRFLHQRRIRQQAINLAKIALTKITDSLARCSNFEELFNLADENLHPICGIGELYTYDTSLRIGAKLDLLPQKIYIHAGTRIGAAALGLRTRSQTLDISSVPPAMQFLKAHEIEDFLCIYKSQLRSHCPSI